MTQEEKDLLLKDLSTRLPYGVKVKYCGNIEILRDKDCDLFMKYCSGVFDTCPDIEEVKPYLFPLSSMTEEQKIIYGDLFYATVTTDPSYALDRINELIDWLNKNHFDHRGLIPKGLAIDATGLNIY
jgi:hypothetical protein